MTNQIEREEKKKHDDVAVPFTAPLGSAHMKRPYSKRFKFKMKTKLV